MLRARKGLLTAQGRQQLSKAGHPRAIYSMLCLQKL
jgi:hypothetical protein